MAAELGHEQQQTGLTVQGVMQAVWHPISENCSTGEKSGAKRTQGDVRADARTAGIAGRTRAAAAADQNNGTSKPTNNRFWKGRQADRKGRLGGEAAQHFLSNRWHGLPSQRGDLPFLFAQNGSKIDHQSI